MPPNDNPRDRTRTPAQSPADASTGAGAVRPASSGAVERFLKQVSQVAVTSTASARGRLLFALDATMSRQPTWDRACRLQAEMFDAAGSIGGLAVKLVYFRGQGEFRASPWVANAHALGQQMTGVACRGGQTQIGRVLSHGIEEARKGRVNALVYVGDAMEESGDVLAGLAGELGLLGVPIFLFHEGGDPAAGATFRTLARVSNGAYFPLDGAAAGRLKALLSAVAIYAVGGLPALEKAQGEAGGGARLLLTALRPRTNR